MTSQLTKDARSNVAQTPGMKIPPKEGTTLQTNADRWVYAADWCYQHNHEAQAALFREWALEAQQAAETAKAEGRRS